MKALSVIWMLVIILAMAGWVKNIVKLTQCDFESSYKAEVLHTVGVFTPLGAIFGWLDLGK